MDVPDFGPPSLPPAAPPPPQQPPSQPVPPSPMRRRLFVAVGSLVFLTGALFVYVAGVRARARQREEKAVQAWGSTQDPSASAEGRQLLAQKDSARLTQKLNTIRALLDRARGQPKYARDVQSLAAGLDACASLIQAGQFERADVRLEKIKRALPPVNVSNPLPVAPKAIDVPAPPQEKTVSPEQPAPPKTTRKKPAKKKPAAKKKKKTRRPATDQ